MMRALGAVLLHELCWLDLLQCHWFLSDGCVVEAAGLGWNFSLLTKDASICVCVQLYICIRACHATTVTYSTAHFDDLHVPLFIVLCAIAWLTRISRCTFIAVTGLSLMYLCSHQTLSPKPSIKWPQQPTCSECAPRKWSRALQRCSGCVGSRCYKQVVSRVALAHQPFI